MGITDRVILTLYTFLMAVFALVLVLCSLGVISQESILMFISSIPGSWEYAVAGVIFLLASIRLLLAGIGAFGVNSFLLGNPESGKVSISKKAIEDYIADIAQEVYGIYGVKVVAKMEDNNISARINASIEPGINIYETTYEIKNNVKETIKKVVGMDVTDIEVFFKQIKNTNN